MGSSYYTFSTCVVSRILLFTDDHKLLVLAIGIAQLLAQLRSGNWYCFAIGIAPAIGIAFSVFRATDFWNLDLPTTDGADDALQFSPLLFFSLLSTHPSVFSLKIYFPTFSAVLPLQTNSPPTFSLRCINWMQVHSTHLNLVCFHARRNSSLYIQS